jgi:hypothetical protein
VTADWKKLENGRRYATQGIENWGGCHGTKQNSGKDEEEGRRDKD